MNHQSVVVAKMLNTLKQTALIFTIAFFFDHSNAQQQDSQTTFDKHFNDNRYHWPVSTNAPVDIENGSFIIGLRDDWNHSSRPVTIDSPVVTVSASSVQTDPNAQFLNELLKIQRDYWYGLFYGDSSRFPVQPYFVTQKAKVNSLISLLRKYSNLIDERLKQIIEEAIRVGNEIIEGHTRLYEMNESGVQDLQIGNTTEAIFNIAGTMALDNELKDKYEPKVKQLNQEWSNLLTELSTINPSISTLIQNPEICSPVIGLNDPYDSISPRLRNNKQIFAFSFVINNAPLRIDISEPGFSWQYYFRLYSYKSNRVNIEIASNSKYISAWSISGGGKVEQVISISPNEKKIIAFRPRLEPHFLLVSHIYEPAFGPGWQDGIAEITIWPEERHLDREILEGEAPWVIEWKKKESWISRKSDEKSRQEFISILNSTEEFNGTMLYSARGSFVLDDQQFPVKMNLSVNPSNYEANGYILGFLGNIKNKLKVSGELDGLVLTLQHKKIYKFELSLYSTSEGKTIEGRWMKLRKGKEKGTERAKTSPHNVYPWNVSNHSIEFKIEPTIPEKVAALKSTIAPPNIKGIWRGQLYQPNYGSYPAVMKIANIAVDNNCGTISYPTLNCGGTLTGISIQGNEYVLRENIEHGKNCMNGGSIRLMIMNDEQLSLKWFYPNGIEGASGVLYLEIQK